jgi:hypothetical protein
MFSLQEVLKWAKDHPDELPQEYKQPEKGSKNAWESRVALALRRLRGRAAKEELHKYNQDEVAQLDEVSPCRNI